MPRQVSIARRNPGTAGVTVFDTDGANPYGREVGALLLGAGFDVDAILPEDVEWLPQSLRALKHQPMNGPASLWSQLRRQIRALLVTADKTLIRRRVLLVIMTRGWPDQLALWLLAMLGARLIIVAHDPVSKTPLPALHAVVRRLFWRSARAVIAHSEDLAQQAEGVAGRTVIVVPHLPFMEFAAWAKRVAPDVEGEGVTRCLVLGQMRADKGLDRLPALFELVPPEQRVSISLRFAGRGDIDDIVSCAGRLVPVVQPPARHRLSDSDIAAALAETDVLIAPYSRVTAYGSVVLALSRNIRVVAYDTGAIREVLAADGLVQPGDEAGFAEALRRSVGSTRANSAEPLEAWKKRSLEAWTGVLDRVINADIR